MRRSLRKSELRELNAKIAEKYGVEDFFSKKDHVEMIDSMIEKDGESIFFFYEGSLVPTLRFLLHNDFPLKRVVVDMGAVRFMASGADVMRPGIVSFDEGIEKGELVVIVDETHKKPLAVGKMLFSGSEASAVGSGKVIKTIHWVGDSIWS